MRTLSKDTAVKVVEIPEDLVCEYCKEREISQMEIGHRVSGAVYFHACCENDLCLKKMVSDRKEWEVGRISEPTKARLESPGIGRSDRKNIFTKYPSLYRKLYGKKYRKKVEKKVLPSTVRREERVLFTHAYFTQPKD